MFCRNLVFALGNDIISVLDVGFFSFRMVFINSLFGFILFFVSQPGCSFATKVGFAFRSLCIRILRPPKFL